MEGATHVIRKDVLHCWDGHQQGSLEDLAQRVESLLDLPDCRSKEKQEVQSY